MSETFIWERRSDETAKSYRAFQTYLMMPVFGEGKRSLENLATKLGLKSITSPAKWSSIYAWQERAAAFDAYSGNRELVVAETGIDNYRQEVARSLGEQLVVLNEIIDTALKSYRNYGNKNIPIDPADINKLAIAIEKKDSLARRLGGMPTHFTTETGQDLGDDATYIIGDVS